MLNMKLYDSIGILCVFCVSKNMVESGKSEGHTQNKIALNRLIRL